MIRLEQLGGATSRFGARRHRFTCSTGVGTFAQERNGKQRYKDHAQLADPPHRRRTLLPWIWPTSCASAQR
jgi:hypothetical protein